MQKLIITPQNICQSILNNQDNLPDILKDAFDLDQLKNGDLTSITYYWNESSYWDDLNSTATFNFDGTNFELTYNDDRPIDLTYQGLLKPIHLLSDWVSRCYDNEQYPWENDAWEQGTLSGDDDVDYNSSYLDCCIAMIELYCLDNKLTYKEFTYYYTT